MNSVLHRVLVQFADLVVYLNTPSGWADHTVSITTRKKSFLKLELNALSSSYKYVIVHRLVHSIVWQLPTIKRTQVPTPRPYPYTTYRHIRTAARLTPRPEPKVKLAAVHYQCDQMKFHKWLRTSRPIIRSPQSTKLRYYPAGGRRVTM